jgi:hypothetical protein
VRLAGAPFIAPALREASWQSRTTVLRLLGVTLPAPAGL